MRNPTPQHTSRRPAKTYTQLVNEAAMNRVKTFGAAKAKAVTLHVMANVEEQGRRKERAFEVSVLHALQAQQ